MPTALDIIKPALRKIGALGIGETLEADIVNQALEALNDMLDSWSNDGLLVYYIKQENFALVPGKQSYTIGVGGDFNTARPDAIEGGFSRFGETDYRFQLVSQDDWDSVVIKNVPSTWIAYVKYEATVPLGRIDVYPRPTGGELFLNTYGKLARFPDLSTDIPLPGGYKRAIQYNLSIELAPEYERSVSNEVARIASDSLSKIKRLNEDLTTLGLDSMFQNRSGLGNPLLGLTG